MPPGAPEVVRALAPLVLFDLDGTLVDTAPDLRVALDALLAQHGRAPCDPEAFRATVSRGGSAMLALGFPDMDPEPRLRMLPDFLSLYASAIATHSSLFDGMGEVLAAIEEGGYWGIVTNKPERLAIQLIESLGLSSRCAVLIGGDTLPTRKPDPAPLLEACRRVKVDAGECVYVGDDRRDIEAARAASMRSVGARWGYFAPEEQLEAWGADCIADHPTALLEGPLCRRRRP